MLAIVITEFLIIVKFGWSIITKPLPSVVLVFWSCAFVGLFSWTMYNFFIQPYFVSASVSRVAFFVLTIPWGHCEELFSYWDIGNQKLCNHWQPAKNKIALLCHYAAGQAKEFLR